MFGTTLNDVTSFSQQILKIQGFPSNFTIELCQEIDHYWWIRLHQGITFIVFKFYFSKTKILTSFVFPSFWYPLLLRTHLRSSISSILSFPRFLLPKTLKSDRKSYGDYTLAFLFSRACTGYIRRVILCRLRCIPELFLPFLPSLLFSRCTTSNRWRGKMFPGTIYMFVEVRNVHLYAFLFLFFTSFRKDTYGFLEANPYGVTSFFQAYRPSIFLSMPATWISFTPSAPVS